MHPDNLLGWIIRLTGQTPPFTEGQEQLISKAEELLFAQGIGYSQFNELLLHLGYDRVNDPFFQYLVDGRTHFRGGSALSSIEQMKAGVDRFRQHALLRFGNIKYAFKNLSSMSESELDTEISLSNPLENKEFKARHTPIHPIDPIAGEDTYYLGYIVERQIRQRLKKDPDDDDAKRELEKRQSIVNQGIKNHESYLTSDHMDVYVATSMRQRHEYYIVNAITSKVFSSPRLVELKLRWFDPTQAYCHDRIDKGLSEALMLKRAKCTLYLAQETDTLGKDSELASTLAQGKPVIAFVPGFEQETKSEFTQSLLEITSKLDNKLTELDAILEQLQVFAPDLPWADARVRNWLHNREEIDIDEARDLLIERVGEHYDKRAVTLMKSHPLGIQVNLETGVANGVLVARTSGQCAELIRRVVMNNLEFDVEDKVIESRHYTLLKERITGCVFRVVTGDEILTNSFWNFYLN